MRGTKNVEIILIASEILQDLRNEGYQQSYVVGDDASEIKTALKDIVEKCSIEKIRRELNLAVCEIQDELYPYTKDVMPYPVQALTNKYKEKETYRISLDLPLDFAQVSVNHLRELCNEYAKARCMQEFTRVVLPSVYESWSLKCEQLLSAIDHVKNRNRHNHMNKARRKGTVIL